MASPISAPTFCCSSSAAHNKPTVYTSSRPPSSRSFPCLKTPKFSLPACSSQLSQCHFTPWNGLKHLGIPVSPKRLRTGRKGRCKGTVVHASLFGVGAPEALVIGVVALLVFGPKGLAEVARNLGKTLRAFQPTIRELQEVSREFKNTLEREIGLDDIPSSQNTSGPSKANSTSSPTISSTEEAQTMVDSNGAPQIKGGLTSSAEERQTESKGPPQVDDVLTSEFVKDYFDDEICACTCKRLVVGRENFVLVRGFMFVILMIVSSVYFHFEPGAGARKSFVRAWSPGQGRKFPGPSSDVSFGLPSTQSTAQEILSFRGGKGQALFPIPCVRGVFRVTRLHTNSIGGESKNRKINCAGFKGHVRLQLNILGRKSDKIEDAGVEKGAALHGSTKNVSSLKNYCNKEYRLDSN
ncbi:hypothetical protein Ancab_009768 [Ancistrocladus abbreviatus]